MDPGPVECRQGDGSGWMEAPFNTSLKMPSLSLELAGTPGPADQPLTSELTDWGRRQQGEGWHHGKRSGLGAEDREAGSVLGKGIPDFLE